MKIFKPALRGRLLADAAVAAIVGKRIHWGTVPPKTPRPYVQLLVISDPRPQDLEGYQDARTTRVQCNIFADTDEIGSAIVDAVIEAVAEPAVFGGIQFGRTKAEGPRDLGESGDQGFIHTPSLDLLAEHSRA